MIVEASGVRLPLDAVLPDGEALIKQAAARALGVSAREVASVRMLRRSVDARKNDVHFIATLAIECLRVARLEELSPAKGVRLKEYEPYEPLEVAPCALPADEPRPVVVGTGPAGLFAALYLARAGLRPLVVERGGSIDERTAAVAAFEDGADLDVSTNVQFGEGGAGTFSDGKLTTGIKSPLACHVLHWFVEAGAPEEILMLAKPHIGTDNLVTVVRNLRERIEALGGEVWFHACLSDVRFDERDKLREVVLKRQQAGAGAKSGAAATVQESESGRSPASPPVTCEDEVTIPCRKLILACGHSARDTFRMLQRAQLLMEPKPFSVGVRIEHRQDDINRAQYGRFAGHPALGAADYKMAVHLPSGRSVYTFCMCPGGVVVPAASEEFGVVVNGMSRFARAGENANAALLVSVTPQDFASSDPLAGMVFQRRIEQAAYGEAREDGGAPWSAPAQTVGDLLGVRAGNPSGRVVPSYARGVVWSDLREVLPAFVIDALVEALPLFDRKLKGFAHPEAVLTGVETRSSSPVRIVRDEATLQAKRGIVKKVRARDVARGHGGRQAPISTDVGIFPCGEGAGYAGGIMSAAVDGLRCAQALVANYERTPEDGVEDAAEAVRVAEATAATVAAASGAPASPSAAIAERDIAAAVAALKRGQAIIFPTDTVYGIGVAVDFAASPEQLFQLKGRDETKPVAWLIGSADDLMRYGARVSPAALEEAHRRWPGAFTVIVDAADAVAPSYRACGNTIGLRVPASPLVRRLIAEVGCPLATTSANKSGEAATCVFADIDPQLVAGVAVALRDDNEGSGAASAVIDYTGDAPHVVRA